MRHSLFCGMGWFTQGFVSRPLAVLFIVAHTRLKILVFVICFLVFVELRPGSQEGEGSR